MIRRQITTSVALALLATIALAPQSASAAMHGRHAHPAPAKKAHLVPAMLKPSYHGYPGYAGGRPGPAVPMLIDIPQVAPGGGVLGVGLLPSTGVFKGVPVLGDFGL